MRLNLLLHKRLGDGAGLLCEGEHLVKSLWVMNCHFRKHLSIQLDFGRLETGDKLAVSHAALANGGVNSDDPQLAEIALSNATVAKRIHARANERFFRGPQQVLSPAAIPLHFSEKPFFGAIACRTLFLFSFSTSFVPLSSRNQGPSNRGGVPNPNRGVPPSFF